MRVAYTAEALGDVAQVLAFVADQSPAHAPDVAARIDMAGAEMPSAWWSSDRLLGKLRQS
jgi:hypothetical protein